MRKILLILAAIVTVGLPAGEAAATPPSDVVFIKQTKMAAVELVASSELVESVSSNGGNLI